MNTISKLTTGLQEKSICMNEIQRSKHLNDIEVMGGSCGFTVIY